jgi:hypothetical protein
LSLFLRSGPDKTYTRFGYNPDEKRWAYGSVPQNDRDILGMLKSVPGISGMPG